MAYCSLGLKQESSISREQLPSSRNERHGEGDSLHDALANHAANGTRLHRRLHHTHGGF